MPVIEGGSVIPGGQKRVTNPSLEGAYAGGGTKIARGDYDFAVDGGAVSSINLMPDSIPANAIILGGFIEVDTVPTSGGAATIAVQAESAGDLQAAAAISGGPWSTTGRKNITPNFTGGNTVKLSAARNLVAVIGTAALTAGKFKVIVFWMETAAN